MEAKAFCLPLSSRKCLSVCFKNTAMSLLLHMFFQSHPYISIYLSLSSNYLPNTQLFVLLKKVLYKNNFVIKNPDVPIETKYIDIESTTPKKSGMWWYPMFGTYVWFTAVIFKNWWYFGSHTSWVLGFK